jgi:hypothetical protein
VSSEQISAIQRGHRISSPDGGSSRQSNNGTAIEAHAEFDLVRKSGK